MIPMLTVTISGKVDWLLDVIGPRYTTASLGLTDACLVTAWAEGSEPLEDDTVLHRLELLAASIHEIIAASSAYAGGELPGVIARGFLSYFDDTLGEAPLVIIADCRPGDGAAERVTRAAEIFADRVRCDEGGFVLSIIMSECSRDE